MEHADAIKQIKLLEAERDLLLRQRALRENYGINFYRPHWKQHKFHVCDVTGRYGRTGNRFGKSEMGIVEDISWCLGGRPWYRESFNIVDGKKEVREWHVGRYDHPYVTVGIPRRPVKGLILVVDWDKAKDIFTKREGSFDTWGKLWKFLPRDAIGKVVTGGRGDRIVTVEIKRSREFGGGSSTLTFDTIESYKHNRLGAESSDWDFIHVDEPCPESMFKAHARGLMDRNGRYWFTCTPLDEMWINDKFTPPGKSISVNVEEAKFTAQSAAGEVGGTRYIITGSVDDNPHIGDAGKAEFKAGLTREEIACRLHGIPLAMAGLVYKEFSYDEHVLAAVPKGWEDYHLPPADHTIRVAWDVHQRIPQALLLAATAPNGEIFFYDELFCESLIEPNATLLRRKLRGRFCPTYLIDPFAVVPSAVTGESVLSALQEYDLFFEPASKDLTRGISDVRELLRARNVMNRQPMCYFSPRLAQTLFEFSHYVYDMEKNEPKDKDNHMMENLYRLVLNGLDYVPPPTDSDYAFRRSTAIRFDEDRYETSGSRRINFTNPSLS